MLGVFWQNEKHPSIEWGIAAIEQRVDEKIKPISREVSCRFIIQRWGWKSSVF